MEKRTGSGPLAQRILAFSGWLSSDFGLLFFSPCQCSAVQCCSLCIHLHNVFEQRLLFPLSALITNLSSSLILLLELPVACSSISIISSSSFSLLVDYLSSVRGIHGSTSARSICHEYWHCLEDPLQISNTFNTIGSLKRD